MSMKAKLGQSQQQKPFTPAAPAKAPSAPRQDGPAAPSK
jgi:hypothetical protein